MAKREVKVIALDVYEEGAVIEGLNRIRNEQIAQGKDFNFVSDLLLKIIRAPFKKGPFRKNEAR